jgi:hypothetical protein
MICLKIENFNGVFGACSIFFAILLMTSVGVTEENVYTDLILLNNGATVEGRIISNSPGKKIEIERADGYRIILPRDRILLITVVGDSKVDSLQKVIAARRPKTEWDVAWSHFIRPTIGFGDHKTIFGFTAGFGLIVEQNFIIGVGAGFETWRDNEEQDTSDVQSDALEVDGIGAPIFVELVGYLRRGEKIPYFYFDGGVLPFWPFRTTNAAADFFIAWGFGWLFPMKNGLGFIAQIGFRAQSFEDQNVSILTVQAGLNF